MTDATKLPVYEIGPKEQQHGFQVVVNHKECTLIVYCRTASEARNAVINVGKTYSGIIACSIMGY